MGEEKYAFYQNPYQAELVSQGEVLNIDITFKQNDVFPYLLNITEVPFDYLVLECE